LPKTSSGLDWLNGWLKYLIALYIGQSNVASSYGAAGGLIVLLLWIYYAAQIFLFGAEFTHAYAKRFGSHAGAGDGSSPTRPLI
jgi:membrane protein